MTNKKSLISWSSVCGLLFVLLVIFYNQLGAVQFALIILILSSCIFLFKFLNEKSNRISLHLKTRIFYGTNKELFVPFVEENKERVEPKKILKYEIIVYIKLSMGVLLTLILIYPLSFFFTLIHELAHAITALVFGAQIFEIRLLSPFLGYTHSTTIPSNISMSLFYIVGSLSVILSGITLSVLIYRSKRMKLEIFFPIWYAIWYNITGTVEYWYRSVFAEVGDAWGFLTYNPDLIPLRLANFCVLINIVLMFYMSFLLGSKIVSRIVLFLRSYIPDLSSLID